MDALPEIVTEHLAEVRALCEKYRVKRLAIMIGLPLCFVGGVVGARAWKSAGRRVWHVRNGQAVPIDPKQLLAGEDIPLQAGDLVQITQ